MNQHNNTTAKEDISASHEHVEETCSKSSESEHVKEDEEIVEEFNDLLARNWGEKSIIYEVLAKGREKEWLIKALKQARTSQHLISLEQGKREEREKIKLRIDYDRRKNIPAEETVQDIHDSIELQTLTPPTSNNEEEV